MTRAGLERLRGIYVLADDGPGLRHGPRAVLAGALEGGATVVQLRLKRTPDGEALALLRWARAEAHAAGALLIVNDRFDLALLAGADGVHLGQDDLEPEVVPADARARLLVGLSTHTLDQLEASRGRPIDYVAFGPIWATGSKESEYAPRGRELLRTAVARAGRPLVAIGGIDAQRMAEVAATGAAAAAVISAVANAPDPTAATRYLQARFRDPPPGRA